MQRMRTLKIFCVKHQVGISYEGLEGIYLVHLVNCDAIQRPGIRNATGIFLDNEVPPTYLNVVVKVVCN